MSDELKKLIFVAAGAAVVAGSLLLIKRVRKRQEAEEEEAEKSVATPEPEAKPNDIPKADKSSLDNDFQNGASKTEYWKVTPAPVEEKSNDIPAEEEKQQDSNPDYPYLITGDEFGTRAGYKSVGLWYFADKVVSDKDYNLIESIDDTIGFESLNHFTRDSDSIYIRNERLKTDYEVVLNECKYLDVIKQKAGDADGGGT